MMIGPPGSKSAFRVLLLGSGELGKEVCIELARLGAEVIACDRYANAPAMQVAYRSHVFDMLDGQELRSVVQKEKPHLIVPEVEAIATETLETLETEGWTVIPTAKATRLTMDREGIRRLAAETLKLPTANYRFANSREEFDEALNELGLPVVVKPIMSSSGKGQSTIRSQSDVDEAWRISQEGGRAGAGRVIVEQFINFQSEITLLTVRTKKETLFCDPVGHKQEGGDYVQSWQPHPMSEKQLKLAKKIAKTVTDSLGGVGLFGVELFLGEDDQVWFSEVSPRPHDTGMVTMVTQQWSEFALHARAIMGYPIKQIIRYAEGASVAVRAQQEMNNPVALGLEQALSVDNVDVRVFGKPEAYPGRRLAVTLASGTSYKDAVRAADRAMAALTFRPED